jgi:hypothetical protein
MGWGVYAGAFAVGAVAAGLAVYFAGKRTAADLTGQGAVMQQRFEAAGRLTQTELQTQANVWARQIAAAGQAQITAIAIATANDVVVREYGITPQFIADAQQLAAVAARARTNPLATLRSFV